MYEVIVIGATFAAAGIAHTYQKECLILEPGLHAGAEFYGALQFGSAWDRTPERKEARALWEELRGLMPYDRIHRIYPYLQEAHVLFGIRPVSVEAEGDGFVCKAYGVEGFSSFRARHVIDTRSDEELCLSKTWNFLMESPFPPSFPGCTVEAGGMADHYVVRIPVPLDCTYPQARAEMEQRILLFTPEQKLILSASIFEAEIRQDLPKLREGVLLLPSKAYENPVLAFEAGLEVTL